jgi:flagellar biosynthesis anti-sigma factor FlgM
MKIADAVSQLKTDNKVDVRKSKPEDVSSSNAAEASDRVELSSGSRDAVKMNEILQSTPPERAEMVEELRAQVERGEYAVDSREVAGKMLLNLLSEQKSVLTE